MNERWTGEPDDDRPDHGGAEPPHQLGAQDPDRPDPEQGDEARPTEAVTEPLIVPGPPAPPSGATGWRFGTEPPGPEATAWSGRPRRSFRTAVAAIVAALVLLSAGIGIGWELTRSGTSTSPVGTESPLRLAPQGGSSNGSSSQQLSLQAIANRVDPAVVDVNTVIQTIGSNGFGGGQVRGAGTGMVLTAGGEVLTNNHVVAGATSISIAIQGRTGTYSATVIGADPTDDVALLQIQGVSGLPTVSLADSSSLRVGQRVVAIGNAFGRGGTPTISEGTVSALGITIPISDDSGGFERLSNLIQTNASISPGDSGGPLVNGTGQIVGIITASQATGRFHPASNVGFAIPISHAAGIVNQIRAGQASSRIIIGPAGFLGVGVRNLDNDTAAQLGLGPNSGALVIGVLSGSPAARAGIASGAVITAIDGRKVSSATELGPAIHTHKPGERIEVTWVDQSGTHTATVSLITGPAV